MTPRQPAVGIVSGVIGLVWAALGLALAAWAATAAIDQGQAIELAMRAVAELPRGLARSVQGAAGYGLEHLGVVAIVAAVALAIAWAQLRKARIALRPIGESHDGKGELQLPPSEARVGRPLEGSIRLRDAPAPGDEFDVILTGIKGGLVAHRVEQKSRARPGAQGVSLPFRLEVPAAAPPTGPNMRWRLEFAPAGKRAFGRSAFEVALGPAIGTGVREASAEPAPQPVHAPHRMMQDAAMMKDAAMPAPAPAHAEGYAQHIEKLAGALGRKLTDAQREQLRSKLAGPEAAKMRQQLELLHKLQPQHLKLAKYAFIAFIVLTFVLPFVMTLFGTILAAVSGR